MIHEDGNGIHADVLDSLQIVTDDITVVGCVADVVLEVALVRVHGCVLGHAVGGHVVDAEEGNGLAVDHERAVFHINEITVCFGLGFPIVDLLLNLINDDTVKRHGSHSAIGLFVAQFIIGSDSLNAVSFVRGIELLRGDSLEQLVAAEQFDLGDKVVGGCTAKVDEVRTGRNGVGVLGNVGVFGCSAVHKERVTGHDLNRFNDCGDTVSVVEIIGYCTEAAQHRSFQRTVVLRSSRAVNGQPCSVARM